VHGVAAHATSLPHVLHHAVGALEQDLMSHADQAAATSRRTESAEKRPPIERD